jgi:hypothetical protein
MTTSKDGSARTKMEEMAALEKELQEEMAAVRTRKLACF